MLLLLLVLLLLLLKLDVMMCTGGDQKARGIWEWSGRTSGPRWADHQHCAGSEVSSSCRVALDWLIEWLSKVYCPTEHIIGHIRDGFLRVKWPNQQCQSTKGRALQLMFIHRWHTAAACSSYSAAMALTLTKVSRLLKTKATTTVMKWKWSGF